MFIDLNDLHNPATSAFVPASWGQQVRDNDTWLAKRPHAHAYNAAVQAIPTATTTALTFNTERRDNAGIHSVIDGSRDVFYLPTTGHWLTWCSGFFEANTTGVRVLDLSVNDFPFRTGAYKGDPSASTTCFISRLCRTYALAGSEVRWSVYQNSGGDLDATFEAGCILLSR